MACLKASGGILAIVPGYARIMFVKTIVKGFLMKLDILI
jgi:hypothetical protein